MMMGHNNKAPWSDPRVRQALSLTLDRDTMIKTLFKGQASVGPFFPWPFLFDAAPGAKELGPYYGYDPAQAKQLLSAAGFANGFESELAWYDISNMDQIMLLWQQSATSAGVNLTLTKSPDAVSHFKKQGDKSWPGLLLGARGLDFVDPSATMTYYLAGNPLNAGDVNDPELEQLNQKLETTSGDARKMVGRQIFDRLNAGAFDVTLPASFAFMFWTSRLHNWRDTSWGANSYGAGNVDQIWLSA
jgi:ABC-type transport system substrate-binding protein